VYNLALNYLQHSGDAEDITQEVFVKIYQRLHTHDQAKASLKTWICKITLHHCIDLVRSANTKKRFGSLVSIFTKDSNEPAIDVPLHYNPGIAAEDKDQLQVLLKHINQLPEKQKTALILLKMEDYSQNETADIMGISTKAVESLFHRAKNSLEKKLSGSEGF
jgi:RNA polymerase sigma factor (sigma-70 family)